MKSIEENKIQVNGYFLDSEQLLPVIENEKYSLIIAGAGSGKTLTLIGKIKYLLQNNIYNKDEICCISFTNEATNNLKNNIIKNCGVEVPTYTFHKLALKILSDANFSYQISNPNTLNLIIDEFFLSKCFGNLNLQRVVFKVFRKYIHSDKNWIKIVNSKELIKYKKTIVTFINLMKSNNYTKEDFQYFFKSRKFKNTLVVIYAIYTIYENEKISSERIDFDDMMIKATKILVERKVSLPFKLIIIDEFQDTSLCRFNLINEIIKMNDASLTVVGDDFQSIYRFSGCDLDLFLNFNSYYKDAKIYKLEKTYRNSLELINVAGDFIQKNKRQVSKNLTSPKSLVNPIIITYFKDKGSILEKVINLISEDKEILIIGRNNFDIKNYTKNLEYTFLENNYIEFSKFKHRKVRYLTIHTSKGLESDVVILLNVENGLYGIPSKLKDEKILSLVKSQDVYPYEEERRLFYVALTRTKNEIYLLTPKYSPSIFVRELKKYKNVSVIDK